MRLQNRKALITGAGSGIGRAMAILFAREGADLALNDIDQTRIDDVVAEVRGLGRQAIGLRFDVSDYDAVQEAAETARQALGGLDVLCANAGAGTMASFQDSSPAYFDRLMKIHLYGAYNCCKAVVDQMVAQKFGRIIVTSSSVGIKGRGGIAAYSAAKAGQRALVEALSEELEIHNITVNAIAPGYTKTNILSAADREALKDVLPADHVACDPEDQAWAAVYLASDEARRIFGQTLYVGRF